MHGGAQNISLFLFVKRDVKFCARSGKTKKVYFLFPNVGSVPFPTKKGKFA